MQIEYRRDYKVKTRESSAEISHNAGQRKKAAAMIYDEETALSGQRILIGL